MLENGDIIDNGGKFQAEITIQKVVKETTFYLFILHLSFLTSEPLTPSHAYPFRVPFLAHSEIATIVPAYLVKKGVLNYGYQLTVKSTSKFRINITLCASAIREHIYQPVTYELVRLFIFSETGSLRPSSFIDFSIRHIWPKTLELRRLDKYLRKFATRGLTGLFPLPYHQSPVPHPHYIKYLDYPTSDPRLYHYHLPKATIPLLTSIADEEKIYLAKFLPFGEEFSSWMNINYLGREPLPNYPKRNLFIIGRVPKFPGPYFLKVYNILILPCLNPARLVDKTTQTTGIIVQMSNFRLFQQPPEELIDVESKIEETETFQDDPSSTQVVIQPNKLFV